MGSLAAQDFFGGRDTGAVHQSVQMAEGLARNIDRGLGVVLAGDVGEGEADGAAELRNERLACGAIEVSNDNGTALGSEKPRRGRTQSRCAAGDEEIGRASCRERVSLTV